MPDLKVLGGADCKVARNQSQIQDLSRIEQRIIDTNAEKQLS
jgi:hypothetical protein